MEQKHKYGLGWIMKKTKGVRLELVIFTFLVILNNLIILSITYFLKLFVDISTGDINAPLLFVGLSAIVTVSFSGIITMLNSVLAQSIQRKMEQTLGMELMYTILSRRMIDISKQHTGELLTKMTADIQSVSNCFVVISKDIVGNIFLVLISMIGLFSLSWKMAIIMLVLSPLMMIIIGVFNPRIKNASQIDKKNEALQYTGKS